MTHLSQNPTATRINERAVSVKFAAAGAFQKDLERRVDRYFRLTGRRRRDCPQMYLKTATIFFWLVSSYLLLVFGGVSFWQGVVLAISLALSMTAVGFNVAHDASHRAYSNHNAVNRILAMSFDLLGGSSYYWHLKHNVFHHTYSNIDGYDDDISLGALGRLSPHQRRWFFHRLQHLYLWLLYGFIAIKWQLYDDYQGLILGKVARRKAARPRGMDLAVMLGGKVIFLSLAFVIPAMWHPLWKVLLVYVLVSYLQGLVLSVVFQLAHVVEDASFFEPAERSASTGKQFAVHQVETTVDFGRHNPLLTWYVGGLNFQIEHHLLPKICHVHYPKLSRLVEKACRRHGIRYTAHETLAAGIGSHFRWLKRMGAGDPALQT